MRRRIHLLLPVLITAGALAAVPSHSSAQGLRFTTREMVVQSPGADVGAATAEVKDALRQIRLAQETYHHTHGRYAPSLAELSGLVIPGDVLLTMAAGADGGKAWWSAAALDRKAPASVWTWSNHERREAQPVEGKMDRPGETHP